MLDVAIRDGCEWFHLIGGTSLPIKTQDQIHDFFDSNNNDKLYFHVNIGSFKLIQDRAKAYYPFIETKYFRKSKLLKGLSLVCGRIQILFGVNRLKNNELAPLYNGWNWFSIPNDFAKYLVSKQEVVEKTFKYTLAADEVWLHSVAVHSQEFRERMYGLDGKDDPINASRHFQDWKTRKAIYFQKRRFSSAYG